MQEEVDSIAKNIAWELTRKMGISGHKLHGKLRRAGRRLPSKVRLDIEAIADAQTRARSATEADKVDMEEVKATAERIMAFLAKQDPSEVRRGFYINFFTELSPRLLVLFAALLGLLVWRGFF
ncbi:hypothetical protein [Actibacterium pelagium]|uniref:Uncharacterized protein n=1 Tax=Actibacterium pelagium TaxID=2029103 RepID=A0A917ABK9_9RHOB|nr:hypothetical protein [Actibacterium pelagium]GGE39286.1 hypothetical protein GCM10011517_03730 [Actibacterium pelagium]